MSIWISEVALAVRDLDKAKHFYSDLIGLRLGIDQVIFKGTPGECRMATYQLEPKGFFFLNIMSPTGEKSTVLNGSLERHGEGIHHFCFEVDDISATFIRIADAGIRLVGPDGRPVGPGGKVGYTDPRKTHGALHEIVPHGFFRGLSPREEKVS